MTLWRCVGSRDSSVSIVGLWAERPRNRSSIPSRCRCFCLERRIETSSGAFTASYSMRIGGSFSAVKAAGKWNRPFPSISEVNKVSHDTTPPYALLACCLFNFNPTSVLYRAFLPYYPYAPARRSSEFLLDFVKAIITAIVCLAGAIDC
jgi:hypothetical protein